MSTELSRLSERAKVDKTARFLSLAHLLTPVALENAFRGLRRDASAGVDEVTYAEYEKAAWENIQQLHGRLVSHRYRAQPLRRVYIPKENGSERPISIPALEDKIVQKATPYAGVPPRPRDFHWCADGDAGPSRQGGEGLASRPSGGLCIRGHHGDAPLVPPNPTSAVF